MAGLPRWLGLLLLLIAGLAARPATAVNVDVDVAIDQVIKEARTEVPLGCAQPSDRLVAIYCAGRVRFGVRRDYPRFSQAVGGELVGYEVQIANAIAARLGVAAEFVPVSAANRIAMIGENRVDAIIATMGHTVQRGKEILFIRPHYYRSETVVLGRADLAATGWPALTGRSVCVTVGNFTNAELAQRHISMLLFDSPTQLIDQLRLGNCAMAAQDDSFFANYLADPEFAKVFQVKLRFAPLPWGIGISHQGSAKLGLALRLISQKFHRDGIFLKAAEDNKIPTEFLTAQQQQWAGGACDTPIYLPACLIDPPDNVLTATPFVGQVTAFEEWLKAATGLNLSLPMFKTVAAYDLFVDGIINSLIIVIGALIATFLIALFFGAALSSRSLALRGLVRGLVILLQSCPIVLLLFFVFVVATSLVQYSVTVALAAAILTLGCYNGSYAGQAIGEAAATLQLETGEPASLGAATNRAAIQIMAFLVNAAKGSAVASMIGAPELLHALTDVTSFSSERTFTYTLLLLFYMALVAVVVALTNLARRHFVHRGAAA